MIRSEQIDLSNYLTSSEVSGLMPSTSGFATNTELSNASGVLNTKINTVSGLLNSGYVAADVVVTNTVTSGYIAADTALSGNFANYATTTSLTDASGTLNSKIDNLTLDALSGVVCPTPTSGHVLTYDGTNWVNAAGGGGGGGGVTDHGDLTGLDDDDHSAIYYNKTTIDNMSGALYSGYVAADSTLSGLLYSGYVDADATLSGAINTRLNNLDLDALSGVAISSPEEDQVLSYNGTNWVNAAGGGSSGPSLNPVIVLSKNDSQSISTETEVSWNVTTLSGSPTYFTHSNSSNNGRVYVNTSGTYLVSVCLRRDDANMRSKIKIAVDGSVKLGTDVTVYTGLSLTGAVNIASGSYISVKAFFNSSKALYSDSNLTVMYLG